MLQTSGALSLTPDSKFSLWLCRLSLIPCTMHTLLKDGGSGSPVSFPAAVETFKHYNTLAEACPLLYLLAKP